MNTMTEENKPHYRAYDAYFHASPKGTGSACKLELHPAHDDVAGSIFVQLAMQKTVGSYQAGTQIFPTFDWENKITLKLDRTDLSQIIQVLRGMRESINDGKGIFHRSANANTIIKFYHQIEPKSGYMLSASRKTMDGVLTGCWFFFDVDEALTLMLSLEQAMLYVCVGIPEIINRSGGFVKTAHVSTQSNQRTLAVADTQTSEEYRAVSGDPF